MAMLLEGQTSDGSSSTHVWKGGLGHFTAWGEFGDGTVTLEMAPYRGTTWFSVGFDAQLTVPGVVNFNLPSGTQLRATLSGASGSPSPFVSAAVD